ncbi:unnamed protein product [Chrysoparadoxa australica]
MTPATKEEVKDEIVEHGEAKNIKMAKALNTAAVKGNKEDVATLLAKGAEIEATDDDGDTALMAAAYCGHKGVVDVLLAKGANIEAAGNNGWTALIIAAFLGYNRVVDDLLTKGANIEATGEGGLTAMMAAAFKGHKEVAEALLERGANIEATSNDGWTALIVATGNGHKEIAEALLAKGAEIEATGDKGATALIYAAEYGHKEVVDALLAKGANIEATDNNGATALMLATENGHKEVVDALLANGANTEATDLIGCTALIYAAQKGCKEIVDALLKEGASIEATDDNGATALIEAAENSHKEVVDALLAKGANIEAKENDGYTALLYAAYNGHKEIADALLEKGAKIEATDDNGATALIYAAQKGRKEIVDALLAKGADIEATDNGGSTALDMAAGNGHKEVIDALLARGAYIEATSNEALLIAAHTSDKEDVYASLTKGGDAEATDDDGDTALIIAAQNGHKEDIDALLANDANVAATGKDGWTALIGAAHYGHDEVIDTLLKHGAKWEDKDNEGMTALMHAASQGHGRAVSALLEERSSLTAVEVGARDNKGKTALMHAKDFFSEIDRHSSSAEDWLSGWLSDDTTDEEVLDLPSPLKELASYDESGAKDIARVIILIIASKRGRLDLIEALLKTHRVLDCRVPARLMALRLVPSSHEEDAEVSKAREFLEILLQQSSGTYSFLDDMEDLNVVTEQHTTALLKSMGGAMELRDVGNDPCHVLVEKKFPQRVPASSDPAFGPRLSELVKKDDSWKKASSSRDDLGAARDKLEFAIEKRDRLLEMLDDDASFGVFTILCVHPWNTWRDGVVKATCFLTLGLQVLVVAILVPLLLFECEDYDEKTHKCIDKAWEFCPQRSPTIDDVTKIELNLQRVLMAGISVLYFSRFFILSLKKLPPPRGNNKAKVEAILEYEKSTLGRLGEVDDFFDIVFGGLVYVLSLTIIQMTDSVFDMLVNSLVLEFVMALDDHYKEAYMKVYRDTIRTTISKRRLYNDQGKNLPWPLKKREPLLTYPSQLYRGFGPTQNQGSGITTHPEHPFYTVFISVILLSFFSFIPIGIICK